MRNLGDIMGNSVNKSDQALVHWLLWSRPVLIFNSCWHTHTHSLSLTDTQTHTHTHTHPGWRAEQPSLSLCCARRAARRGAGAHCVFRDFSSYRTGAGILWITVSWSPDARPSSRTALGFVFRRVFCVRSTKYFGGIYCGRSVIGAFSVSELESYERGSCSTKTRRVLSRSAKPVSCWTLAKWKKLRFLTVSWRFRRFFFRETKEKKNKPQWRFIVLAGREFSDRPTREQSFFIHCCIIIQIGFNRSQARSQIFMNACRLQPGWFGYPPRPIAAHLDSVSFSSNPTDAFVAFIVLLLKYSLKVNLKK